MTTRTALVTGVVGGIGAAIASRLATDGAKVIVSDLPGEALVAAADRLRLPMIAADLGDPLSVSSLKDHLLAQHGNPDIIVNAAGGVCNQIGTSLEEVEPSGWKSIFAANVDSALHLAQSFVPAMKTNQWGRVITISSGAGLRPSLTGIHAYTAAKHAFLTRGDKYSVLVDQLNNKITVPKLNNKPIDAMGAGDIFHGMASVMCVTSTNSFLNLFLSQIAGAHAVDIEGNSDFPKLNQIIRTFNFYLNQSQKI